MDASDKIDLTKLDVARRQLKTAIVLFFNNGDPVSIHTLACAGHEILYDLRKSQGIANMLQDTSGYIKEGMESEYFRTLNRAKNFFKHADRDPDDIISFDPKTSSYFLLDAVVAYFRISGERPPIMVTFNAWMRLFHSNLFVEDKKTSKQIKNLKIEFSQNDRISFFKECLPAMQEINES